MLHPIEWAFICGAASSLQPIKWGGYVSGEWITVSSIYLLANWSVNGR